MANETVFRRYEGNPIITPEAVPTANSIFNSAVLPFEDRYVGIFRVDTQEMRMELHVGWSEDALHWEIDPEPIKLQREDGQLIECLGYDPRVTELEGTYYITRCHYPAGPGPAIGLAKTQDFKTFYEMWDVLLPYNRNAVLFPRKIHGQYAMLHRPSDTGHTPYGDIYYCTSPDLINWGRHRFVFGPTPYWSWQNTKVGAGPAPIETKEGWLLIYHGVRTTCTGYVYCAGGALLDLDEPWKVIYRSKRYLLAPTLDYERVGDVPDVVFPTAAILDESTGRLALYYGCADTTVSVAYAQLGEIIDFIEENSF